jgi:Na+/H+ antiporter NhaD/arsenite permease-like protein
MNLGLLVFFGAYEFYHRKRDSSTLESRGFSFQQFSGWHNLGFLAVILLGVFLPSPWRELLMAGSALGSYLTTRSSIRRANQFDFHPLAEVGWLFLGIFATMIPVLAYLHLHASELGLEDATHYYFACGLLSSILDNAPTYLTFLAIALAQHGLDLASPQDVLFSLQRFPLLIQAISLGAVFFGAATYIGNGPNFMIKAMVEQSGLRMPGFFAYIWRFSLPILVPLLLLIGWWWIH